MRALSTLGRARERWGTTGERPGSAITRSGASVLRRVQLPWVSKTKGARPRSGRGSQ